MKLYRRMSMSLKIPIILGSFLLWSEHAPNLHFCLQQICCPRHTSSVSQIPQPPRCAHLFKSSMHTPNMHGLLEQPNSALLPLIKQTNSTQLINTLLHNLTTFNRRHRSLSVEHFIGLCFRSVGSHSGQLLRDCGIECLWSSAPFVFMFNRFWC
jgi:hypothetical protein